jgi:Rhodopirellula transposase DDE domain/Winged helix-turn helix
MGQSLALRTLTSDEVQQLKAGLRSPRGFTLRRCQILLASAKGLPPSQFAATIGCSTTMVRNVLSDFHERGIACVHQARRREGALPRGRPRTEAKDPTLRTDLEQLVSDELAGSPVNEQIWVRSSSRKLRDKLREKGHQVGHCTVLRLLREMGFSLRVNKKRRGRSRCSGRDEQFQYIASQKKRFKDAGLPSISIDTKQKVLIGNFLRPGKAWGKQATEVNDHDFTSMAECRGVPFGIYDLLRKEGHVTVGISNDTPEFAVSAIARWWEQMGSAAYCGAAELLILADCGGTNGPRFKAWHLNVQEKLCDRFGLTVTVCHYPPGCSKWNPIERLLFSQISINWAAKPLKTLEIMLGYIRGTSTSTGLKVTAYLDEKTYRKKQKVNSTDMARVHLKRHDVRPQWNYTLNPRR